MEAEQQSNVDHILDAVEKYAGARFRPDDRQRIHDDLSRSKEIVEWRSTRDYPYVLAPSINVSDPRPPLINVITAKVSVRGGVLVTVPFEKFIYLLPRGVQRLGLMPRSWAGYYLLDQLANTDFFPTFVDLTMWERDDIPAMERHRLHQAIHTVWHYNLSSGLGEAAYRTLFVVVDLIEATNLAPRIRQYHVAWDEITVRVYNDNRGRLWTEVALLAFAAVQEAVAAAEEVEFGRGSPAQRAAADEFDRNRGALLPRCDFWTYTELEFWARLAVVGAAQNTLCDWLRSREEISIEGDCEQLPHDEVLATVREATTFVSKAPLCSLLQIVGFVPPTPMHWDDVTHHNVKVLPYLPLEVRPSVVDVNSPVLTSIKSDLIDKLFPLPAGTLRPFVSTQTTFKTLTPQDPPLELSSNARKSTLIVLSGVAAVSPIDFQDEPTTTAEIVALREGELLALRPEGGYSDLVIRAGAATVRLLYLTFG